MNADGALAGGLELLAEFEDRLGRLARLVAVEQRLAVLELADRARGRVEAQRQLVAVRAQAREQERIAADVGGDVDVRIVQLAVLVEEHVDALVEAHQRDRDRIVADREDDREMALGQARTRRRSPALHGSGRCCGDFSTGRTFILPCWPTFKGSSRVIEKRQTAVRRGGRHADHLLGSGVAAAIAGPAVKLCGVRLYWPWPLSKSRDCRDVPRQFIDCSTHRCEARR